MPEEKEVIDAEVVEEEKKEEPKKEEKKQSGWSKFWAGAKKSLDDSLLESRLQTEWNDKKGSFTVYSANNSIFGGKTFRGTLEGNSLVYYVNKDEKGVELNTVLVEDETKKAFYVVKCEKQAVIIHYEDKDYEREGYRLELNPDVKEVKVIKAGDKYYLNPAE